MFTCKSKLAELNGLVDEPCIVCIAHPAKVTNAQFQNMVTKYVERLELTGFHCDDPEHTKKVHDQLGPVIQHWSCCKKVWIKAEQGALQTLESGSMISLTEQKDQQN